ncbi:CvpA family protein [Teredinibacter purpureus]|uniref:CvpA family protein n=1 Tax=Teredinibacter purpureus TaxID=2731756 RepID=UPI0005F8988C|nr:CvpA family protein [Teredinibacter purpureus]
MSWITPLFIVWVAYNAWRGYKRGLGLTLLSLVGLAAAYFSCYSWGPFVSSELSERGWHPLLAYCAAFLGVYLLVYVMVAELPSVIFARWLRAQWVWPGAVLGMGVGVVSGLIFVWVISLVETALVLNRPEVAGSIKVNRVDISNVSDPVSKAARVFVAEASLVGAQALGMDIVQARLFESFVRSPQHVIQRLEALGQSQALRVFVTNGDVQRYLHTGNLEGLVESGHFQQLITQPEMAPFRELALEEVRRRDEKATLKMADIYLASRLSQAWRRMNTLREQPEIKAILADSDVKSLIESRNIPALLMHPKVQVLLGRVLETDNDTSVDGRAYSSGLPSFEQPSIVPTEKAVEPPAVLFKWQDSEGRVHYGESPPDDVEPQRLRY